MCLIQLNDQQINFKPHKGLLELKGELNKTGFQFPNVGIGVTDADLNRQAQNHLTSAIREMQVRCFCRIKDRGKLGQEVFPAEVPLKLSKYVKDE